MQKEPKNKPKVNSFLIGISFLASGIILFVVSVFFSLQIVCLIGLGLIFWGALFLLIPPPKLIEASFLITSSLPGYLNIDRMLSSLIPKNEAYNIPACPRDISLPDHLKGLKQMVTFIPAAYTDGIAEIEDIARGKFLIEKPKGLLITSPGVSLLDKIEQKNKTDFAKIPISELDERLPVLFSLLYLAKEIELTTNENEAILRIHGSLYKNLYNPKYELKSVKLLGCPLVNAVGCAIAKSTGKPTMIKEIQTISKGNTITVIFNIVESEKQSVDLEYWKGIPEEKPKTEEEPKVEEKPEDLEQPIVLENREDVPEVKPKGLLVTEAEIFDNVVRFFVEKGFLKKRLITVKEIPVYEITSIENSGNTLNVTWKNVTDSFFTDRNSELFINLCERVNGMLEEERKSRDIWKVAIRRNELLAVIDASVGIIDFAFNILIGLQTKPINWQRLRNYSAKDLLETFSFTGQLMPSLNLNFQKISSTIKSQNLDETSKEAYNILKIINSYFDSLSADDDLKESVPNFLNAKAIILSYCTLNYLLLGRVVGEKVNDTEYPELERVLKFLAESTNFKVNVESLKASIDKVIPEIDLEGGIDNSREIFKEQFLLLVYKSL
jgi:hypothetical protein